MAISFFNTGHQLLAPAVQAPRAVPVAPPHRLMPGDNPVSPTMSTQMPPPGSANEGPPPPAPVAPSRPVMTAPMNRVTPGRTPGAF